MERCEEIELNGVGEKRDEMSGEEGDEIDGEGRQIGEWRPIIAMDYFFMIMESGPSAQSISEESTTCVAVKEHRHQNIMSSVALKKGVEEPWTVESYHGGRSEGRQRVEWAR